MAVQERHDDEGIVIRLTIDGTTVEDVEVKIAEPRKTVRDQIVGIVTVFELPKLDNEGNPLQHLLGRRREGEEEPEILEVEDENGHELTLLDYNIRSGDHLHLITIPTCGGIWCNILIVKDWGIKPFNFQSLKIYKAENRMDIGICRLYGWIDEIIKRLVLQFNLPSDRQYYLAKLNKDNNSNLRFFFLNGGGCSMNNKISIFAFSEDLKQDGNEYQDVILFPTSGISKHIMKKIDKFYNRVPRFLSI